MAYSAHALYVIVTETEETDFDLHAIRVDVSNYIDSKIPNVAYDSCGTRISYFGSSISELKELKSNILNQLDGYKARRGIDLHVFISIDVGLGLIFPMDVYYSPFVRTPITDIPYHSKERVDYREFISEVDIRTDSNQHDLDQFCSEYKKFIMDGLHGC